jgi:hypothetical protein
VPAPVEDLFLESCPHNIKVKWQKTNANRYWDTHYDIAWVQIQNGKNSSSSVLGNEYSFVIENLEADAEYEVSVTAVNCKGEKSSAVTGNTKTGSGCKYQTYYIVIFVMGV